MATPPPGPMANGPKLLINIGIDQKDEVEEVSLSACIIYYYLLFFVSLVRIGQKIISHLCSFLFYICALYVVISWLVLHYWCSSVTGVFSIVNMCKCSIAIIVSQGNVDHFQSLT